MSQKQKLRIEEKVNIIQAYLRGEISKSEAVRRGGVNWDTMNQWIHNYEADGAEAFLPHKNRVYSPEVKRASVQVVFATSYTLYFTLSIHFQGRCRAALHCASDP